MTDAESPAAAKRRMRRIPSEFRKRNAQSCDRCRKRRCKCVPSPSGDSCVTCVEHNATCSYTTPRRTRFYGSVDELSDRYRCLEAIVKGAFPNEGVRTASELVDLGQRLGFPMPDITDASRPMVKIEELVRQPSNTVDAVKIQRSSSFSHRTEVVTNLHKTRCSSEEPGMSLVKDTVGNEHYIGPTGTLNFLSKLRKLVDDHRGGTPRSAADTGGAANKFAQDDTAQALEADDEPETAIQEETTPSLMGDNGGPSLDSHSPGSMTSSIARDFTRLPATDADEILRQFPNDEVLDELVSSYFTEVHDDFPLFHRATFQEELERFVAQARRRPQGARARDKAAPDWGWIGCLHMVLVFGSISNPKIKGVDHNLLRRRSVAVARALLPQFISKCTLTNVRVLLLLSFFLHNNNERNAAWNLVGAATRISFALGLHRSDMNSSFRPLEREVRKWVFCTLYTFEQFLASSLGRPSGLQEVDVEIVPPREGFLDGGNGSDAKLVSLSLKLQAILARTRLIHITRRKEGLATPYVPSPTVEEVLESLDAWKSNIKQHHNFDLPWIKDLGTTCTLPNSSGSMDLEHVRTLLSWRSRSQLRAVVLLHVHYHYITIVATRPLLLQDVTMLRKSEDPVIARSGSLSEHGERCVQSAQQLAFLALLLDMSDSFNGLSGLDVYYAYCAAMVLILRLLRTPKSSDAGESGVQAEAVDTKEHELQKSIQILVSRVQRVMNMTDKSGSMKRFTRVSDAFFECVINKGPPKTRASVPGEIQPDMREQQQVRFDEVPGNYGMMGMPGYDPNLMPAQAPPTGFSQFGDVNMDEIMNLFPFGGVGGHQPMMGPGQMPPFPQEDVPLQAWADMEGLLGGYGVQG